MAEFRLLGPVQLWTAGRVTVAGDLSSAGIVPDRRELINEYQQRSRNQVSQAAQAGHLMRQGSKGVHG